MSHSNTNTPATEHPVALSIDGEPTLFPKLPYNMHTRSEPFTHDDERQKHVNRGTYNFDSRRRTNNPIVFGERHEALRTLAGNIKQHTLDHLDYYLQKFIDNATAAGTTVHFAKDGHEANAIAVGIAKREKCKLCVKSKSMVTEETHLVPELEAAGIETVETDLGEFIIQLDDDAPSHIVAPMIHKDKLSVARAFQSKLGAPYTEDAEELTKIAREHLREKFRKADLGISGGNFMVAESGSVIICTNEGNGRLCTTAPRVHVAFIGIEKLVPTYEHVAVLLKLLARHATAQPLTVYTHMMTGPKRAKEHDGPEQVHIILVDNGRTNLLRDTEYRSALRCIRCGACLNACPVYRKISGHGYGSVYSGPIGAVITPLLKGLENYKDLPHASSLCGACYEACPVKINLPELLIKLRRDMLAGKAATWKEKLAYKLFAIGLKTSLNYKLGGIAQRLFIRRMADRDGYLRKLPGPVKGWTDVRDLPAPAKNDFRKWWKGHEKKR